MENTPRRFQVLVSVCFLASIITFGMLTAFSLGKGVSIQEKRALAQWPGWPGTGAEIRTFALEWSTAYDDRLWARTAMIRLIMQLRDQLPSTSGYRGDVLKGKNGWLYYAPRGPENTILDLEGKLPFPASELKAVDTRFTAWQQWFEAQKIPFLIIVTPTKASIHPEHLPDTVVPHPEGSNHEQILTTLQGVEGLQVLPLKPVLRAAREHDERDLYQRTDSHWNSLGAAYAFEPVQEALITEFPELNRIDRDDYTLKPHTTAGGDLAWMLTTQDQETDENFQITFHDSLEFPSGLFEISLDVNQLIHMTNPYLPDGPRVLIYHDSFGNSFKPFWWRQFRETLTYWTYDLNARFMEVARPDMVILFINERFLHALSGIPLPNEDTPPPVREEHLEMSRREVK